MVNSNNQINNGALVRVRELYKHFPVEGSDDVWRAGRSTTTTVFGSATIVQELATSTDEQPSWISDDECVLYVTHKVGNTQRIYRAVRSP